MNEHVEVVKKWLADKHSVSHEELRANADAAADAAGAAGAAAAYAADAAYAAYAAADAADAADAAYWVKKYEELNNDK